MSDGTQPSCGSQRGRDRGSRRLSEHNAFDDTFIAVDDGIGMLGWTYDDSTVRLRDGGTPT